MQVSIKTCIFKNIYSKREIIFALISISLGEKKQKLHRRPEIEDVDSSFRSGTLLFFSRVCVV